MAPSVTRRPPWTVRVASFSAAHRWPVIALWFVATIGIFLLSLAAGGTDAENAVQEDSAPEYESGRAYDVFNASGTTDDPSQDLLIVISSGTGTVDDEANCRGGGGHRDSRQGPHVHGRRRGRARPSTRSSTRSRPRRRPVSSRRTGTTVRVVARMPGEREVVEERLVPVPAFLDELRAGPSRTADPRPQRHPRQRRHRDARQRRPRQLACASRSRSTFAILLVAFGAAVAAFVPLILAVTSLLAAFGVLALYSQFVSPVSPYASQLVVLIGLAVAVDYSLFMITRFRTERRAARQAGGHRVRPRARRAVPCSSRDSR